jgi:hypothetical protein
MAQDNGPKKEPAKGEEGARPARGIVSQLSEHEKTVRDQELLLSANKYFGGLSDEEKALLGLDILPATDVTSPESLAGAQQAPREKRLSVPDVSLEAPGSSAKDLEVRVEEAGSLESSGFAVTPNRSAKLEWVWAGLTALIFAGVVGWVLAGQ